MLVAVAVPPIGRRNTLLDFLFDDSNGSFGVPAVEVAPVSLTAEAMVPSMIPFIIWFLVIAMPLFLLFLFWFAFSHGLCLLWMCFI